MATIVKLVEISNWSTLRISTTVKRDFASGQLVIRSTLALIETDSKSDSIGVPIIPE